jgi:hypothetical protein
MRHFILSSLFIIASSGALAQTNVSQYKPGVTPEGVTYFLPRTSLRVVLQIEKTTYKPGDFCKYSERYFSLNGTEYEPYSSFKIISARLYTIGVPDKKKCYTIKFDAKSSASNIKLNEDGILLSINADAIVRPDIKSFTSAHKPEPLNPRKYLTEEILTAGSSAKMAELIAQEIYDIRENRDLLNKGQADYMPKDGEQLKIMLNNLNTKENALTQLFTGTIVKDTTENVISIDLDRTVSHQVLFRFSKKIGLTDADDVAGLPYYINVEDQHSVPPVDVEAAKKLKKPEKGVYVNVPGKVNITITSDNQAITSGVFSAAQFGNTEVLSDKLFNKKYTTHVTLDPTTGGLLKFDAEQPK